MLFLSVLGLSIACAAGMSSQESTPQETQTLNEQGYVITDSKVTVSPGATGGVRCSHSESKPLEAGVDE